MTTDPGADGNANADTPVWSNGQFRVLDLAALAVLLIGFGVTAGPLGLLAGLVTASIWYAFGVPYAVAVGHVLLAVLFANAEGIPPISVLVIEIGFVAVLVAAIVRSRADLFAGVVACGVIIVIGTITWFALSQSLAFAAGIALVTLTVAGYVLHRYGLVRLGLVSESAEMDTLPFEQ